VKDLLSKLSSYNIFNNLLPGVVFVVLVETLTTFSLVQKDVVLGVFLYYFIGLVISRIGSLLIEPLLKLTRFVQFANYPDFVSASSADTKLDTLSESNNMYRTFCSLFLVLLIVKGYERLSLACPVLQQWTTEIVIGGLLALFAFAYRKQTAYITKRVETTIKKGQQT